MSGGSYNYLYSRAPDEIASLAERIHEMAEAIERSGFPMTAKLTEDVASSLRWAAGNAAALADLWKAQEWYDSCDSAVYDVRAEAVKLGEELPPCAHSDKQSVWGLTRAMEQPPRGYLICKTCGEEFL